MPITELVLMTAKSDPELRKELDVKLPVALKEVFSGAPGLESLYVGTSPADADNQDGICLLLKWQHLSQFDTVFGSPEFAAFRASVFPYFAGLPDIQLFESTEGIPARIAADLPYLHTVRSLPGAADDQAGQLDQASVEDKWKAFIEQCKSAPSASQSLYSSFTGFGLRKNVGAFLGATIWKDNESINSVLNDGDVKQLVQQLQQVAGKSDLVHLVLKLNQVALE